MYYRNEKFKYHSYDDDYGDVDVDSIHDATLHSFEEAQERAEIYTSLFGDDGTIASPVLVIPIDERVDALITL